MKYHHSFILAFVVLALSVSATDSEYPNVGPIGAHSGAGSMYPSIHPDSDRPSRANSIKNLKSNNGGDGNVESAQDRMNRYLKKTGEACKYGWDETVKACKKAFNICKDKTREECRKAKKAFGDLTADAPEDVKAKLTLVGSMSESKSDTEVEAKALAAVCVGFRENGFWRPATDNIKFKLTTKDEEQYYTGPFSGAKKAKTKFVVSIDGTSAEDLVGDRRLWFLWYKLNQKERLMAHQAIDKCRGMYKDDSRTTKAFLALIEVPKVKFEDREVRQARLQMYYKGWRGLANWFRKPVASTQVDVVKHKSLFHRVMKNIAGYFDFTSVEKPSSSAEPSSPFIPKAKPE